MKFAMKFATKSSRQNVQTPGRARERGDESFFLLAKRVILK